MSNLEQPNDQSAIQDWTEGKPGIAYQHCKNCAHRWYYQRDFCPSCGAKTIERCQALGHGVVAAVTQLHRAPSKALQQHTPYTVVLVCVDEGFLVMGHAESADINIGDHVTANYSDFGDNGCIPIFKS